MDFYSSEKLFKHQMCFTMFGFTVNSGVIVGPPFEYHVSGGFSPNGFPLHYYWSHSKKFVLTNTFTLTCGAYTVNSSSPGFDFG